MRKYFVLVAAVVILAISGCKGGTGSIESLSGLIINEVVPAKLLAGECWFELYNQTSHDINVNGMKVLLTDDTVTDEVVATVNGVKVPSKGYCVISSKDFKFSKDVLRSKMVEIGIMDANGSLINSFSTIYDLGSSVKPEDGGSYARIPDAGTTWAVSNTATPGEANYTVEYKKLYNIIFNEVCAEEGWVELASTHNTLQKLGFATFTKADGTVLCTLSSQQINTGEKLAVDFKFNASEDILFKDNLGNTVATFKRGSLTDAPSGGSWSRLPDVTGEFCVTETSTKGTANTSKTSDEKGMVLNEASLKGGWIEIANSTVRNISTTDMKIYGVNGGSETLLVSVGKRDFAAGSKVAFSTDITAYDTFNLKSSSGTILDTFKKSNVKDSQTQTTTTSWSRIPDMTGNWYTVITPSKNETNWGITCDNAIAMWLNYSSMGAIDLDKTAKLGIGNIILHEYGFVKKGKSTVDAFLVEAHKRGIKVHIWLQCFWWNDDIKWRSAVIDPIPAQGETPRTPARYNQEEFDDIIARAKDYLKSDIDGLHLDYVRFGGTASKHNWPEDGITGIGAITEFCRQFSVATRDIKSDIILSAALMGEKGAQSSYGQEPEDMAKYLDILMPMAYISSYGYSDTKNIEVANWFTTRADGKALVWHGISTYDHATQGLSSERILHDCTNITKSNANGIALFRYGLGDLPDLNALYRK